MQPQQQESLGGDFRRNFDIMVGLMTIMAFPAVMLTTRSGTWGSRFLGLHAVLGFLWPLVFGAFYGPDPGLGAVLLYWQASILVLLVHRLHGVRRRAQGYRCHSLYWGESIFEKSSDADSKRARGFANVLLMAVGAGLCAEVSKPLGTLLIIAAVCKAVTEALTFQAVEARVRQMEDARIENSFYLDRYRQRNPD
jgi:hypothetical protein